MTTQPEALLEAELVAQLRGMGHGYVTIQDEAALQANLQALLEAFNGTTSTQASRASSISWARLRRGPRLSASLRWNW